MKRFALMVLILTCFTGFAAETKRPSWSQGLPVKKQMPSTLTTSIDKQSMLPDVSDLPATEVDVGSDTFNHDVLVPLQLMSIEPDFHSELPTQNNVKPIDSKIQSQQLIEVQPEAQDLGYEEVVDNEKTTTVAVKEKSSSMAQKAKAQQNDTENSGIYSWNIMRQFPIKVSSKTINTRNSLLIKVMIDNRGNIVAVERVLDETPEYLMRVVERSMKRWKFVAPEDEGIIKPLLSRVFKVALTPRS